MSERKIMEVARTNHLRQRIALGLAMAAMVEPARTLRGWHARDLDTPAPKRANPKREAQKAQRAARKKQRKAR